MNNLRVVDIFHNNGGRGLTIVHLTGCNNDIYIFTFWVWSPMASYRSHNMINALKGFSFTYQFAWFAAPDSHIPVFSHIGFKFLAIQQTHRCDCKRLKHDCLFGDHEHGGVTLRLDKGRGLLLSRSLFFDAGSILGLFDRRLILVVTLFVGGSGGSTARIARIRRTLLRRALLRRALGRAFRVLDRLLTSCPSIAREKRDVGHREHKSNRHKCRNRFCDHAPLHIRHAFQLVHACPLSVATKAIIRWFFASV